MGSQKEPSNSGSSPKMSDSGGYENFKSPKHMAELSPWKWGYTAIIPEQCYFRTFDPLHVHWWFIGRNKKGVYMHVGSCGTVFGSNKFENRKINFNLCK